MDFTALLSYSISIGPYTVTLGDILLAIIVIVLAKILLWSVNHVALSRFFKRKKIDRGRQFALRQFISYIVWTIAIFAIIEIIQISSMIWASFAALLVGIGLGLQDVFKDFVSGIVLLVEGTVEVGDVIEVGGMAATVTKIGMRSSYVETRDKVNILIPNSMLIVNKVTNWSHKKSAIRFCVSVGVKYGSDLSKVQELLLQIASKHPKIVHNPPPEVQFKAFNDSSLDFDLYFYSYEMIGIEIVKSDIRFSIEKSFRQNGIVIPFPQREVWIKKHDD